MNFNKKTKMILTASSLVVVASVLGACGKESVDEKEKVQVENQKPEVKDGKLPKPEPKEKGVGRPVEKPADTDTDTKTGQITESTKAPEASDKDMMPPVPTAQEMTDVMKTFDSYEEFKGKLAEVGVVETVASLNNQVIAGNGVKELKSNIHFYQAKDKYFALYETDDKILKDAPESIVLNVWEPEDAKAFIAERKNTK